MNHTLFINHAVLLLGMAWMHHMTIVTIHLTTSPTCCRPSIHWKKRQELIDRHVSSRQLVLASGVMFSKGKRVGCSSLSNLNNRRNLNFRMSTCARSKQRDDQLNIILSVSPSWTNLLLSPPSRGYFHPLFRIHAGVFRAHHELWPSSAMTASCIGSLAPDF
jgi:hypothetical protein